MRWVIDYNADVVSTNNIYRSECKMPFDRGEGAGGRTDAVLGRRGSEAANEDTKQNEWSTLWDSLGMDMWRIGYAEGEY